MSERSAISRTPAEIREGPEAQLLLEVPVVDAHPKDRVHIRAMGHVLTPSLLVEVEFAP